MDLGRPVVAFGPAWRWTVSEITPVSQTSGGTCCSRVVLRNVITLLLDSKGLPSRSFARTSHSVNLSNERNILRKNNNQPNQFPQPWPHQHWAFAVMITHIMPLPTATYTSSQVFLVKSVPSLGMSLHDLPSPLAQFHQRLTLHPVNPTAYK